MENIIFKKPVEEFFEFIKKEGLSRVLKNAQVDNIYQRAYEIETVKTIWERDKPVNLNSFYYPLSYGNKGSKRRIEIEDLTSFNEHGKIVIEGIAGQGKTILLRYLAGKALRMNGKIPVFIELRKISKENSLPKLIVDYLNNVGIKVSLDNFDKLLAFKKFVFLFDAFDEIQSKFIGETLHYIEQITSIHESLVIVSARPGAEIQKVPIFEVFELKSLQPKDHEPFLSKLFQDNSHEVDRIVKAINDSDKDLKGLLKTPLLMTLLCITYVGTNSIPKYHHEFYQDIFNLLIKRHDKNYKPWFIRETKSGLGVEKFEPLFWGYCFEASLLGKDDLPIYEAARGMKAILNKYEYNDFDPHLVLEDIYRKTNLILEEGDVYCFVHRSIKEYHAAKFVKDGSRELKEKFYTSVSNDLQFSNILHFLSTIDPIDHARYFMLPKYVKFFKEAKIDINKPVLELEFLSDTSITIKKNSFYIDWGQFGLDVERCLGFSDCFIKVNQRLKKEHLGSHIEIIKSGDLQKLPFYNEYKNFLMKECLVAVKRLVKNFISMKKSISSEYSYVDMCKFPSQTKFI